MIICQRHLDWVKETCFPDDVPRFIEVCKNILKARLEARKVNPVIYERLNPMACFICIESEEIILDAFNQLSAEAAAAEKEAVDEAGHG